MTVTLDLPDDVAAPLLWLSETDRAARVVDALRGLSAEEGERALLATLPEQDPLHVALAEGYADVEAGRTISLEDYIAERQLFWAARGTPIG